MAETGEVSEQVLEQFMQYDADKSGAVTREEYLEVIRARALLRFEGMDKNKDEKATPEEYKIFWQERKRRFYKMRDK